MNNTEILKAGSEHLSLVPSIIEAYDKVAVENPSAGFAKREKALIEKKIEEGKAVIALVDGKLAGFGYMELWDGMVSHSGLIVLKEYRGAGLASKIKSKLFEITREKYPQASIFGLTTSDAVLKINADLGYKPVSYAKLPSNPAFWKGCEGCPSCGTLKANNGKCCLCTAMVYDPCEPWRKYAGKKVVVAFSGGLDTSFAVKFLSKEIGCKVYAVCADTGGFTKEQLAANEVRAMELGAESYKTIDVSAEYYAKSLKYMVFGNVLRGGTYPISVSSERLFQAVAIARYASELGAAAIAHGSTGAGNDQVRFDMTFKVLAPGADIITLTRDLSLSRNQEINYLKANGLEADFAKMKYSYNVGIWGTSICGGELNTSDQGLPEDAYLHHVQPGIQERKVSIGFENGEISTVDGVKYEDKVAAIKAVESMAAPYGIGRDIHVGDTIIGIKGRVGFEAAAAMLIIAAHKHLEKYTLSKWQQYWKAQIGEWYGMFLHESQYLDPVMRDMEAMLTSSQRQVTGTVNIRIYPKGFEMLGVESANDLVHNNFGEYGEGSKGWTAEDAKGFINLLSTPLKVYYSVHPEEKL